MFKKLPLYLIRYSIIPALLYLIPAIFFLKDDSFSQTWILYIGNAFFLCYIFVFALLFFKNKVDNKNSPANTGIAVTVMSIALSCALIVLSISIFAPGLFHFASSNGVLANKPPSFAKTNEFGIWFILFANATIGNFVAGAFSAVVAAAIIRQGRFGDESKN